MNTNDGKATTPQRTGPGTPLALLLLLGLAGFLLLRAIAGPELGAQVKDAERQFNSPIETPIETQSVSQAALPPIAIEPLTDPTEIAAHMARNFRPSTPTAQATPVSPTRRPHLTSTPFPTQSPLATQTALPEPLRVEVGQANLVEGVLATATPAYVYTMLAGMKDFWYKNYTWKGVGGDYDYDLSNLQVNWWREWSYQPDDFGDPDYPKFVFAPFNPMENPWAREQMASEMAFYATDHPGRVWLLYNEPDFPTECVNGQCNLPIFSYQSLLCQNKFVHQEMVGRGYGGPTSVPGEPTYADRHSFNPDRPVATTPTPGVPEPLDRIDPCVWPTAQPPGYYSSTVYRQIPKVGGGYWGMNVRVVIDAMAKVLAEDYAALYSTLKAADPTARVFCCGNFHTPQTEWWLAFLYHLQTNHPAVHLDGVHLHTYPWTKSTHYIVDLDGDLQYDPQDGDIFCRVPQDQVGPPGIAVEQIWSRCLRPTMEVYFAFHQSVPETKDKPIWISEYGVLSNQKAQSGAQVASWLLVPLAGWIGRSDHRYTGVAWFISQSDDNTHITEYTELLQQTPTPVRVLKIPLGATWAAYPTAYPPTVMP